MRNLDRIMLMILLWLPLWGVGQQIDSTFGEDGFVFSAFENKKTELQSGYIYPFPNGQYMIAGATNISFHFDQWADEERLEIWFQKLLSDGSPDSSFGNDGFKSHELPFGLDKVYAYHSSNAGNHFFLTKNHDHELSIFIFDQEGEFNLAYGDAGRIHLPIVNESLFNPKITTLSNGDIYLGHTEDETLYWAKIKPDGSFDKSFGSAGIKSFRKSERQYGFNPFKVFKDSLLISQGVGTLYILKPDGSFDKNYLQSGRINGAVGRDFYVMPNGNILLLTASGITMYEPSGLWHELIRFYQLPNMPSEYAFGRMYVDSTNNILLAGRSDDQFITMRLDENFAQDTSYGYKGIRRFKHFGATIAYAFDVSPTPDHGIIFSSKKGLTKLNSTGNLDENFGEVGSRNFYTFITGSYWNGLTADPYGNIWTYGGNEFHEMLLNGFDADGKRIKGPTVIDAKPSEPTFNPNILSNLIWGEDGYYLMGTDGEKGFLRKYTEAGKVDTTFTEINTFQNISNAFLFPSGNIAVASTKRGVLLDPSVIPITYLHKYDKWGEVIPRFQFSRGLWGAPVLNQNYHIAGMSTQANEGLILGASFYRRLYLGKFQESGLPDSTYGKNGWAEINPPWPRPLMATFFKQLEDGKSLLGYEQGVGCYLPDGSLDSSFYEKGWLHLHFDWQGQLPEKITIDQEMLTDSSFIQYGTLKDSNNIHDQVYMIHYQKDGVVDKSFGENGLFVLEHPGHSDRLKGMLIQSDSAFVMAGISNAQAFMVRISTYAPKAVIPIDTIPLDTMPIIPVDPQTRIYPNPSSQHQVFIRFQLTDYQHVEIRLHTAAGEVIQTLFTQNLPKDMHEIPLQLPQNLAPGTYLIQLQKEATSSWHKIIYNP